MPMQQSSQMVFKETGQFGEGEAGHQYQIKPEFLANRQPTVVEEAED